MDEDEDKQWPNGHPRDVSPEIMDAAMDALNQAHEQAERLKAIHEDGMNNLRRAAIKARLEKDTLRPRLPRLGWRYYAFVVLAIPVAFALVLAAFTALPAFIFLLISKDTWAYIGVFFVFVVLPLLAVWAVAKFQEERKRQQTRVG
jgi:polyferredoxin